MKKPALRKKIGKKQPQQPPELHKRIAFVSTHGYVAADPPLGAPDTGGQVVYILELAKKLGMFGYEVDIWTRQFEDQTQEERVDEKVRILRAPCGGKDFISKEYLYEKIPEWSRNALTYIKRNNLHYDFINSHYWDAGLAGEFLKEELNIPHIHTPHSLGSWKKEQMETDFPEDAHKFEEKYNFSERIKNEMMIYRHCDLVTATTPIQIDKIESSYGIDASKLRMIPPGYDDNRYYPIGEPSRLAIREQLGFNGRVIFSLSRLAHNKGVDLLIEGFNILQKRFNDAILYLAIGHENRSESEEELFQHLKNLQKKYGLEENIVFLGYIPDEELPDYYRASDLFVLSSRYEPFGMVAIEALACGTPTVITIHGGLYRILEYGINTLFADPFDHEELGITMFKALRYKTLRNRLRTRGAQIARSRFTWTGIAQQLLNAVDSIQSSSYGFKLKPKSDFHQ
jgi:mannosylfructose-phosphate synthase